MDNNEVMERIELINKIKALKELQTQIEEAQEEADTIKDYIKLCMGDTEELRAGEYKVTWKKVTTRRLDAISLKKAMPDIAAAFTKESTTRRFNIS